MKPPLLHQFSGHDRKLASQKHDTGIPSWQTNRDDIEAHRPFRDFRYWIGTGDGQAKCASISGTPLFANDGSFLGYRGSGSDVTAEAESALRTRMLSTVVEQSPMSVVITDPNGTIEYVNSHLSITSGYEAAEIVGRNPRILASGNTPVETYQDMWATITAGKRWAGELHNRRKSGELYWEIAVIAPILNDEGQITRYLAIKEDVTERRLLQDKLRQINAELEQFAYVASHDLRQPLRMISSYLSQTEQRLGPQLDEDTKKFIGYAVDGAKRLDRLILDLLEYSRTGKSREQLPVAIGEVVGEALTNLAVAIGEAEAEIVIDDELPTVSGDLTDLVRLFQNLIGNAIKYRSAERKPRIQIGSCRRGSDWLISIRDNGIGIAPEQRERAFAIFQRLVARGQYEGSGIGLAICKKIVEQHGGRIWIESAPSEGTIFTFTIPRT